MVPLISLPIITTCHITGAEYCAKMQCNCFNDAAGSTTSFGRTRIFFLSFSVPTIVLYVQDPF